MITHLFQRSIRHTNHSSIYLEALSLQRINDIVWRHAGLYFVGPAHALSQDAGVPKTSAKALCRATSTSGMVAVMP